MDEETIDERLRAVERAVTEEEPPDRIADRAALSTRLDDAEADLDDLDERLADLEAAVQALRGYVGAVRGVNREVEQRADAALAKAERLEPAPDRERAARDGQAREPRRARDGGAAPPEHPVPEPPTEQRPSLRERIADWL